MKKRVVIIWDILVVIAIICSILIPSEISGIENSNTIIDDDLQIIQYVNNKAVELEYPLLNEEIHSFMLYFDISTDEKAIFGDDVQICYNVLDENNEFLCEGSVKIEEIIKKQVEGKLIATEFKTNIGKCNNQVLHIRLWGLNIPSNLEIGILGNDENATGMVIVKDGVRVLGTPLYQIEISIKKNRYTWDLMVILMLSLLYTVLAKEISDGESKAGTEIIS